ncbi:MAG: glycosyltransferase family A protein [Acetobacteraceae bacterium]
MSTMPRCAVVTPYLKEDRALLERCMRSVVAQTVKTEHFMVADGFPQAWIDDSGVRHFKLDRTYADNGTTPRAIGAILAMSERYDAIAWLDADNWFEPDHVECCLDAARSAENGICDYVIARRNLVRPDETIIDLPDEPMEQHVDTNCFFHLSGSFHLLTVWGLIPREVTGACDRMFYAALKSAGLIAAVTHKPTVNYHCLWESVYRAMGESPPPGAKPAYKASAIHDWLTRLSDRELQIARRRTRIHLVRP